MPHPLLNLARNFDSIAAQTWRVLEYSTRVRMPLHEDSITQLNVLQALFDAEHHGADVLFVPVTQQQEARIGADFEIWIRLAPMRLIGYSIQAKRAQVSSTQVSYPALAHPGEKVGEFQYDVLLRHAAAHHSNATHLFYNGWDRKSGLRLYSGSGEEVFGCAVAPTAIVKAKRELGAPQGRMNNRLSAFVSYTSPWSSLLRFAATRHPRAASAAVPGNRDAFGSSHRPSFGDQHGSSDDGLEWTPRLATSLPGYVLSAMESSDNEEPQLPRESTLPEFVVIVDALD